VSAAAGTTISFLPAAEIAHHLPELGMLLHACVEAGASVGFVLPCPEEEAAAFWRKKVLPAASEGLLLLLAARRDERIVGAVLLDCDTMPNQRHRAEARKLLVHPAFRRRGIARALMAEMEDRARRLGRTLITLDTRTGDPAEALYVSMGYKAAGIIPGYCRAPFEDRLESTTILYKALS
jgi:ribosomal protein S18 acetylase RimI-like enzyme